MVAYQEHDYRNMTHKNVQFSCKKHENDYRQMIDVYDDFKKIICDIIDLHIVKKIHGSSSPEYPLLSIYTRELYLFCHLESILLFLCSSYRYNQSLV